jgi:5-methylthioribose kinase
MRLPENSILDRRQSSDKYGGYRLGGRAKHDENGGTVTSSDEAYHVLDVDTVGAFAARFLPGEVRDAQEIGDGNLNLVFRVSDGTSSVIVKQALPYLRVAGESWPLTRHRARIEGDAILTHAKLAPEILPGLVYFDESLSALVLEDLSGHESWREVLIAGGDVSGVAEHVGRYCARVLLGTSDVVLSSRERKALRQRFIYSELCLVTEDLVFTAPYIGAASNRFDPEIADLAQSLTTDAALRRAAAELRFSFKTRDEALLHGDLHSGSVMIKNGDPRVIDLEFAYFGPLGFDPGALLAHLAIARLAHAAQGRDAYCRVIDDCAAEFWGSFVDECRRLWKPTEPWLDRFLNRVLGDAGCFAGMEMIRRIVGLAHAKDIDSLPAAPRQVAQRHVVAAGRSLVLGPPCGSFAELWDRATQEELFA